MREGSAEQAVILPLTRPTGGVGTDELNLAEFPLAVLSKSNPEGLKTLVFEDDIFDEGAKQRVRRKLVVSGSDAFGLPTPADSDVLLVLMWLTERRNQFTSPTVPFTRYEMVGRLGWDPGGKSYRRIDDALQRWASVTLHYNRAWWNKQHQNWRSQTFHVLESLDLRGRTVAGTSSDDSLSTFTWNPVLFESFRACNVKRLDLDEYFRLRLPTSRQAYRFLDKRFYRAKRFEMDLRVFACEHVGLGRNYDSAQLRRKLAPALQELETIGFLVKEGDAERYQRIARGQWKIRLRRSTSRPAAATGETEPGLIGELVVRGIGIEVARELFQDRDEPLVRQAIEYHDWLVAKRDKRVAKNPAGFLAAAIRNQYRPPGDFLRHRATSPLVESATSPSKPPTVSATIAVDPRHKLHDYLASLSADDRDQLQREAVASAAPFQRATAERLTTAESPLLAELQLSMIETLLASRGITFRS